MKRVTQLVNRSFHSNSTTIKTYYHKNPFISLAHGQSRFCSSSLTNNASERVHMNTDDSKYEDFAGVVAYRHSDLKLDFANVKIGQELVIPYEITVTDNWREMWQSVFYQQDRLFTSLNYVEHMKDNLKDYRSKMNHDYVGIPLPFTLVLSLASSMSHVDEERVVLDLSFRNCVYKEPVMPGDTLHRHFTIENVRESKNGKNIIVDISCKLYNQYNENVFALDKTMFYEKLSISDQKMKLPSCVTPYPIDSNTLLSPKVGPKEGAHHSNFRHFLLRQQYKLLPSVSLKTLFPKEVILHSMQRPLGTETNMQISTMHRMTHPALYNTVRYKSEELVVGGVSAIGLTHSLANKELFEIIYEELHDAQIINKCQTTECFGALTYIHKVTPLSNILEEVECTTLGVKNVDITQELSGIKIPLALFEDGLKPSQIEGICKEWIPQLRNKIVVQSTRRVIRKMPTQQPMPLL